MVFVFLISIFAGCAPSEEDWQGKYTYEEIADAQAMQIWEYEVEVYSEANSMAAHVTVNGFQTGVNLKCNVLENNNRVKFVVSEIEEGNLFEVYKVGDVLFEFEKNKGAVITHWVKMLPNIENAASVGMYFVPKK